MRKPSVAIIGGGYAGMACAVELAAEGIPVTVFEASRVLGGRARRVEFKGLNLDNGQHLLIAAYRELLRLMTQVHPDLNAIYQRRPLQLLIKGGAQLSLPALPAPWDGAIGFMCARGLRWRDKWAAVCLLNHLKKCRFKLNQDLPLDRWLQEQKQPESLVKGLWEPLCLAALNTPLNQASAQVFAHVLRDSLLGGTGAADLVLPKVDLSALFPEPAAAFVKTAGGSVRLGERITAIEQGPQAWQVANEPFAHVVLAVGPQHASALLERFDPNAAVKIDQFSYQSITTVWLQYDNSVMLPAPMLGLNGGLVQWVFDRGQLTGDSGLIAAVISVDGPHLEVSREALTATVLRELQDSFKLPATAVWSQTIIEKRATFACVAGIKRPQEKTAAPGLWLTGDYVASDYPATLEGAVRSGVRVAHQILEIDV